MKRRILAGLVLVLSLVVGASTAHAADDFVNVTFKDNGTCTNSHIIVPIGITWSVTSRVFLAEKQTVDNRAASYTSPTGFRGSGKVKNGTSDSRIGYSAKQPYTFSFDLTYWEEGKIISHSSALYRCDHGVATLLGKNTQKQVPKTGFVLRTITCYTPIYQAPGGNPVATGEYIVNGQTWFVSPTPVKDAKGESWTEIFVGGYSDGFIRTACVGGRPTGYAGN